MEVSMNGPSGLNVREIFGRVAAKHGITFWGVYQQPYDYPLERLSFDFIWDGRRYAKMMTFNPDLDGSMDRMWLLLLAEFEHMVQQMTAKP